MKKFLLSILTFLYLMVSTGFAMEIHYCMGERSGIEFFGGKDDKCGKCGMTEKKGGCCSNEHKFYKYDNNFKQPSNNFEFSFGKDIVCEDYFSNFVPSLKRASVSKTIIGSPPDPSNPPIFIRNCVFRL